MVTKDRNDTFQLKKDCIEYMVYFDEIKRQTNRFSVFKPEIKTRLNNRFQSLMKNIDGMDLRENAYVCKNVNRIRELFALFNQYYVDSFSFSIAPNCTVNTQAFLSGKTVYAHNGIVKCLMNIIEHGSVGDTAD
ncbi:MAG: hypothetical protein JW881_20475 [Spirochaetales bacterium]|nr:hypothetical protein [Spirochaetales bacterium]